MRQTTLLSAALSLLAMAAVGACGDPLSLPPATVENRIDTLRLYSASRSPIYQHSAYLMSARASARLDQLVTFDFIYDTDGTGGHFLVPYAAATNTTQSQRLPGFQPTDTEFDAIDEGQQTGYVTNERISITPGDIFYVRSAVSSACPIGLPFYGKLEVLGFDEDTQAVIFRFLININCGYRGLELGIPRK